MDGTSLAMAVLCCLGLTSSPNKPLWPGVGVKWLQPPLFAFSCLHPHPVLGPSTTEWRWLRGHCVPLNWEPSLALMPLWWADALVTSWGRNRTWTSLSHFLALPQAKGACCAGWRVSCSPRTPWDSYFWNNPSSTGPSSLAPFISWDPDPQDYAPVGGLAGHKACALAGSKQHLDLPSFVVPPDIPLQAPGLAKASGGRP